MLTGMVLKIIAVYRRSAFLFSYLAVLIFLHVYDVYVYGECCLHGPPGPLNPR